MIRAQTLSKHFGDTVAVDGIDFTVEPGKVTGFLGPNGAGKSTTMRMALGLDAPSHGSITVNDNAYATSPAPLRLVGALLDTHATHPGRSARDHLRWLAASNDIPTTRVDEVLELVGLHEVAGRRAGKYSLGMGQRLGIAAAMLGDPPVLILDEPVNGLDPEGIRWVRTFARQLAGEGRTVFISSHLMSEMALMADHLIVIGRGRILADSSMSTFLADHATSFAWLRTPAMAEAGAALAGAGYQVLVEGEGLRVTAADTATVGDLLHTRGLAVHELTQVTSSLEDAFMRLTADSVDYHAHLEGVA